jgi:hypothetical protein
MFGIMMDGGKVWFLMLFIVSMVSSIRFIFGLQMRSWNLNIVILGLIKIGLMEDGWLLLWYDHFNKTNIL